MTRRWVILSIPGRSTMKDKRSVKIGILAEDQTDCKTIEVLVGRLLSASGKSASFSHRGKDGCANLRRKAKAWMGELTDVGCAALILIHDLDRNPSNHTLNDEAELRGRLAQIPVPRGVAHHICIPVEEVGAWFWSCPTALERVAPGQENSRAKPSPPPSAKAQRSADQVVCRTARRQSTLHHRAKPRIGSTSRFGVVRESLSVVSRPAVVRHRFRGFRSVAFGSTR